MRIRRPTPLKTYHVLHWLQRDRQPFHRPHTVKQKPLPDWLRRTQDICCSGAKTRVRSREMCENVRGLKVKKRTDRHRVQGKLRPLFVNNTAGRREHVALQNSRSPAVGSGDRIKEGSRAAHLPPQPSARGRKSAFSLDPWRGAEYQAKQRKCRRRSEMLLR